MKNKKQTAVEWLYEQMFLSPKSIIEYRNILDQAKAMHKEEIINACNQNEFEEEDNLGIAENLTKGEQYYNETYEK
jgi:hypothetical protein